ncbi:MAG: hypothetical protein IKC31_02115 [Clostridia bacterium]|nr:hypothetical protein [Clostridia bacterium]
MPDAICAVFSVVDAAKSKDIAAIYKEGNFPIGISTHGFGMADSSVLELLGFGENKKNITVSLLSKKRVHEFYAALEDRLQITKPGRGIVFSVPMTSATAFLVSLTNADTEKNSDPEKECELAMAQHEYELIITIVTKGNSPDVMAAANAAGARGGTLIHALGLGAQEAQKFLGIAIQPEKDLILNVVHRTEKAKVMKAIGEAAGVNTEGKGILFSLPVDEVLGLRSVTAEERTTEENA